MRIQTNEPDENRREPTPFERFQELARRLFAVPKEELDEKKAEYDNERKRANVGKVSPSDQAK